MIREGYYKKLKYEQDRAWEIARFQAHTTYSTITAALGADPVEISEWFPLAIDKEHEAALAKLKTGRAIDPDYKREMEARMNAIP
ncbi:MAG: hypothetical protein J7619_07630 [Dyadobacter sp.]|uniref:hypothetical protein n=1 Tax=Dyadobacter sp. TaxID=1914288 RepID=UPI001B1048BA|nr:hypothetical protein [Dyadobacter sp.]MBO9612548.1 hypothetical protein [Dyadobacter sp.]